MGLSWRTRSWSWMRLSVMAVTWALSPQESHSPRAVWPHFIDKEIGYFHPRKSCLESSVQVQAVPLILPFCCSASDLRIGESYRQLYNCSGLKLTRVSTGKPGSQLKKAKGNSRYFFNVWNAFLNSRTGSDLQKACEDSAESALLPHTQVPRLSTGGTRMRLLSVSPFQTVLFGRKPLCTAHV